MKKYLYLAAAVLSLNLASCYNDDDVWDAINGQEERIAALEAWQKIANENITALQAIVNGNDYIKAVTPITENGDTIGYTISFLRQGDVTLYHGKEGAKGDKGDTGATGAQGAQGEKGDMPVIGVTKQSDGYWYWTLNGELLKDAEGNPICASGKDGADGDNGAPGGNGTPAPTPQIKAENGDVLLSVDGGVSWTKVNGDDGTNGDSYFSEGPKDNGSYWTFTLTDGTKIDVPKYTMLALSLKVGDKETPIYNAEVTVGKNQDFSIVCKAEMGCKWSYKVLESENKAGNNWPNITLKENSLEFDAATDEGSVTILFTLTMESNQVMFYQVTIHVKEEIIIKEDSNPGLVAALIAKADIAPNSDGDIAITPDLIKAKTTLDLSNANLTSLDGIECFTEVTELKIGGNNISSVEVSTLTKLEILDVSNNPLSSLDVSKLKDLKSLTMSNCFSSSTRSTETHVLDLSQNKELTKLVCDGNGLTSLNLSNNNKLSSLDCKNNNLTELDVKNKPELVSFECYNNKISTLDISQSHKLTYFNCGGNLLTDIDVSQNTVLSDFNCWRNKLTHIDISNNKLLRNLCCHTNQLSQLDLSSNKQLQTLYCENNQLTELNLQNNSKLEILYCSNNMLETLNISPCSLLQAFGGGEHSNANGDIIMNLTINSAQKSKWEESWKKQTDNINIVLAGVENIIPLITNNGADFGNGGVY